MCFCSICMAIFLNIIRERVDNLSSKIVMFSRFKRAVAFLHFRRSNHLSLTVLKTDYTETQLFGKKLIYLHKSDKHGE